MTTRIRRRLAIACALALGLAGTVSAQDFPNKALRLIVPFPAGGVTDILARSYAQALSDALKQPVVVDNRPGAGGNVAMDLVAKAPADGYTIGFGAIGPLAINVTLFRKMAYDPLKDLAPVTLFGTTPNIIATSPTGELKTLKDVIDKARARGPGALTYASGGNGTTQHLGGEMINAAAGIKITHVPWNGDGAAIAAVMGKQVPMLISGFPAAAAQVKAGNLLALAVTGGKRSPLLPDVPTVAEATGFRNIESGPWFGIVAPAGTPRDIVNKLNAASHAAMKSQTVADKIAMSGGTLTPSSPEQFGAFMQEEVARWSRVVKDAGAQVD